MQKTLVLGASINQERASNRAVRMLVDRDIEVSAIGIRGDDIVGVPILRDQPELDDIDTITLYMNPKRQVALYDYIFSLSPRRIIFNPGTENPELMQLAKDKNIEVVVACSLVMLSLGEY